MSQFSRTFATAASSLASRRHYTTCIALPPRAVAVRSPPTSPSSALFSRLGHGRSASQSSQPASPRSPMQICSPPRSPAQMQFAGSPSQMNFGFGTSSPFVQPSPPQPFVDLSHLVSCAASPAGPLQPQSTISRSISPVSSSAAAASAPVAPRPVAGRKPAKKAKRDDDGQRKKPLNSFTFYRKMFPEWYPEIDALIPTQKERSTITGAIWQAEDPEVKDYCRRAVQVERTPQKAERLEFVRQRMSNKRQQERAASGTDRLQGRNLLVFKLWQERKTKEEIESIVATWEDEAAAMAEPKRKRRRVVRPPAPAAPALHLTPAAPTYAPLPFASPSPAGSLSTLPPLSSPAASTPAADFASPAPSTTSLPTQDSFDPDLSAEVADASYQWTLCELISQPARSPLASSEPLTLYVNDWEADEVALRLRELDPSDLPYELGGEGDLAALNSVYAFPEHYGRSPYEYLGEEVGLSIDNGSY